MYFSPNVVGPFSSFDLLAILPFLVAALIVFAVRRMRRKKNDPR